MKKRILFLSLCIILLSSVNCFAEGNYRVGKDEGGVYLQTDNYGGWYIDESDLKYFKIGQNGTYSMGEDREGTFLLTDNNRKIYIDIEAKEKQDAEIAEFNKEYERKMEQWRQQEIEKKAQENFLKAQQKKAKEERDFIREMEEKRLKAEQKMHQERIEAEKEMNKKIKRPIVPAPIVIVH